MNPRILQLLDVIESNIGLLQGKELRQTQDLINMAIQKFSAPGKQVFDQDVQVPPGAEALWVLSGGNPRAFQAYLKTFPNAELNSFAQNKLATNRLIDRFSNQISMPYGETSEGIPKADVNSSNVYGFQYDPRSKSLRVKFNGKDFIEDGPIYEYANVPPFIARMLQQGAIPAKTDGSNRWGAWWKGKSPSLGSSMYSLIKMGGFPYTKLS